MDDFDTAKPKLLAHLAPETLPDFGCSLPPWTLGLPRELADLVLGPNNHFPYDTCTFRDYPTPESIHPPQAALEFRVQQKSAAPSAGRRGGQATG